MNDLTALELLVLALASYRITRLITVDTILGHYPGEVPGDPDKRGTFIRGWLDRRFYDSNGADLGPIRGWLGALYSCPWCMGVWVSAALWYAATQTTWSFVEPVCVIAAIAGAQGYIASRMNA